MEQVKNAHPPQPLIASKAKSAKIASAEKKNQAAQSVAQVLKFIHVSKDYFANSHLLHWISMMQKKGAGRKKKVRSDPDVENDEILNAVPQVVEQQVSALL